MTKSLFFLGDDHDRICRANLRADAAPFAVLQISRETGVHLLDAASGAEDKTPTALTALSGLGHGPPESPIACANGHQVPPVTPWTFKWTLVFHKSDVPP